MSAQYARAQVGYPTLLRVLQIQVKPKEGEMTKQEGMKVNMRAPIPQAINKVLLELLSDYQDYLKQSPLGARYTSLDEYIAKAIRNVMYELHSQGVVIKVERELPPTPQLLTLSPAGRRLYAEVGRYLLKAGYTAVEPLIEEE